MPDDPIQLPLPPQGLRSGGEVHSTDERFLAMARNDAGKLAGLVDLSPATRILDFGCGVGRLLYGLADVIGPELEYLGLDVRQEAINWCREHLAPAVSGARFLHIDLFNERYRPLSDNSLPYLPFPSQSFEVAYAYSVLSHMAWEEAVLYLAEMRRILCSDGSIVLTAFVEEDVTFQSINPEGYGEIEWSGPLHCVRFERNLFEKILRSLGLDVVTFSHRTESDGQSLYALRPAQEEVELGGRDLLQMAGASASGRKEVTIWRRRARDVEASWVEAREAAAQARAEARRNHEEGERLSQAMGELSRAKAAAEERVREAEENLSLLEGRIQQAEQRSNKTESLLELIERRWHDTEQRTRQTEQQLTAIKQRRTESEHRVREAEKGLTAIKQRRRESDEHRVRQAEERLLRLECQRQEAEKLLKQAEFRLAIESSRSRHYLGELRAVESYTEALARSRRWRIGSAVVGVFNRVLRRGAPPTAFDCIGDVFSRLNDHLERLEEADVDPRVDLTPTPAIAASAPRREPDGSAKAADIVVCIHDAPRDVEACLASVLRHTNLVRNRLILVDDGSTDPATREVLDLFVCQVPCTVMRNEQARGYTVAANQGLAASTRDYVVLLNSDTLVTPGWLDKLIRCADTMPETAVVGPLSNAASWQSIPHLAAPGGGWAVNDLPAGMSADDLADSLDRWSTALYPSAGLINGFCYMISRAALDQVGFLDEVSFPRGYGEEDDFSLRCLAAGFRLYVADDCYVYHGKSKSYSPEGRSEIVASSKRALEEKHGKTAIRSRVSELQANEELVRARTYASLVVERAAEHHTGADGPSAAGSGEGLRMGWIVPHLGEVGGIRRTIEMTNRLVQRGWEVDLITPEGEATAWLPILGRVETSRRAAGKQYNLLVVNDPDVVEVFLELKAETRMVYHLAPYMLYRPDSSSLRRFYSTHDAVHLANSTWTAEKVEETMGVKIRGVFPGGVEKRLFHPSRRKRTHDVVCYGSRRPHKGTPTIEEAARGLTLLKLADLSLRQDELAWHIGAGQVFASACWHEGFNFLPLEAMACGVPVVTTDDGGSREYVVDGENALVVQVQDPDAMREKIHLLMEDRQLRVRLITNGLRTAWEFDWDRVTKDFANLALELHQQ